MKLHLIAPFIATLVLTACAAETPEQPGPVLGANADYYDGYYDGFYGPFDDGYWSDDGFFWYRGGDHHWRRDDGHHFTHVAKAGITRIHGSGAPRVHGDVPHAHEAPGPDRH